MIEAKSGQNVKSKWLKILMFSRTPETEGWEDNAGDKVAKEGLRPPNPKRPRGSQTWIAQLYKPGDGLVDEQDHEEERQEDAVLLQGDQGLAKTRDIVRLGHLLRREVEVHDAQQEEEEESQEDKFGL